MAMTRWIQACRGHGPISSQPFRASSSALRIWWAVLLRLVTVSGYLAMLHLCPAFGQSWIANDFPALNWQPTIAPAGARYVGNHTCAQCHASEAKGYLATPMAQALTLPQDSKILHANPSLTFRNGSYVYAIQSNNSGSTFTVTDGKRTISAPIRWAVGYGTGGVGQTFVLEYSGLLYESRVSYFAQPGGLDITVGHPRGEPEILEDALGNWLGDAALMACLQCHATAGTTGDRVQAAEMIPGVACEACHGPGAEHVEAMRGGNTKDFHIFNPGRLSAGRITDFCGACHRTATQERVLKVQGVENARFQGYRLQGSRCYDPADSRITCTACHNPHQTAERLAGSYDAKCAACHDTALNRTKANAPPHCPVGKQNCVTCHMPQVSVAGAHAHFTDHRIRVLKPNEPYPN
jgi:hypothetical protein